MKDTLGDLTDSGTDEPRDLEDRVTEFRSLGPGLLQRVIPWLGAVSQMQGGNLGEATNQPKVGERGQLQGPRACRTGRAKDSSTGCANLWAARPCCWAHGSRTLAAACIQSLLISSCPALGAYPGPPEIEPRQGVGLDQHSSRHSARTGEVADTWLWQGRSSSVACLWSTAVGVVAKGLYAS